MNQGAAGRGKSHYCRARREREGPEGGGRSPSRPEAATEATGLTAGSGQRRAYSMERLRRPMHSKSPLGLNGPAATLAPTRTRRFPPGLPAPPGLPTCFKTAGRGSPRQRAGGPGAAGSVPATHLLEPRRAEQLSECVSTLGEGPMSAASQGAKISQGGTLTPLRVLPGPDASSFHSAPPLRLQTRAGLKPASNPSDKTGTYHDTTPETTRWMKAKFPGSSIFTRGKTEAFRHGLCF